MRFTPGSVVATPGALELLERTHTNAIVLLQRHLSGDWGELSAEDKQENERSLEDDCRLLSNYSVLDEEFRAVGQVWIITEADRSVTTLLLPEEY